MEETLKLIIVIWKNTHLSSTGVCNMAHCFLIYCNIGNHLMQQGELGHVYFYVFRCERHVFAPFLFVLLCIYNFFRCQCWNCWNYKVIFVFNFGTGSMGWGRQSRKAEYWIKMDTMFAVFSLIYFMSDICGAMKNPITIDIWVFYLFNTVLSYDTVNILWVS